MSLSAFAELLGRLAFTPSRNAKLVLVRDYLRAARDPERGWALAALTGELGFDAAKPALIRRLAEARVDPQLFAWSYDYVGDLAETAALVWPAAERGEAPGEDLALEEVVDALRLASRAAAPALIAGWLDRLDAESRYALLKLLTGALRVGVSARLAKTALADLAQALGSNATAEDVEEVWHGLSPPYGELFAWIEGRGPRPDPNAPGRFRPVMLAQPLDEATDLARLDPSDYAAEWKWDGVRVQAVVEDGAPPRLYSRTGEDVGTAFPDLVEALLELEGGIVLDGELLVLRNGEAGSFSDLQQRLNRKAVDARALTAHPAGLRAYDLLAAGGEDLRGLPFRERRARLEAEARRWRTPRLDLSPVLAVASWEALAEIRRHPPPGEARKAEGLMLKRWDSVYEAGRPKGPWFKWKRDPFLVDAVLMYAQRGHGKRSSFYSDYTFGVWKAGELTPVGKAYFGFTDEELRQIDRFVRENTTSRYGPVRAVRADRGFGLVLEVAFEGLQRSTRHKSGLAMRFPRVNRIRWDKPSAEADDLETLERLLEGVEAGRIAAEGAEAGDEAEPDGA